MQTIFSIRILFIRNIKIKIIESYHSKDCNIENLLFTILLTYYMAILCYAIIKFVHDITEKLRFMLCTYDCLNSLKI